MVELHGIGFDVRERTILDGVDVAFAPGVLTAVLGPNGAGKSTLLRIAAGLRRPTRGSVRYAGTPLTTIRPDALARRRAVLSQHSEPAFPLSVEEVVGMGRYPHFARVPGPRDRAAVARALERVGLTGRRAQRFSTLSGGEQQAVQMARVLAQMDAGGAGAEARVLFLDEPTANLDVRHQLRLLALARSLLAEGVTVVAVLHDLNLASEHADRFVVLERGRVAFEGDRASGLPAALLERVYQVRARRVSDGEGGGLWRFGP